MVSVMIDFFRKDYRARVYALLSIVEEFTRLIGTPLIQTAWARGIEWGGDLLGLPFWILAVSFKATHISQIDGHLLTSNGLPVGFISDCLPNCDIHSRFQATWEINTSRLQL